jgi:hypothetical protein
MLKRLRYMGKVSCLNYPLWQREIEKEDGTAVQAEIDNPVSLLPRLLPIFYRTNNGPNIPLALSP